MLEHVEEILINLEKDESVATRQFAIHGMRTLGLDDFGMVLLSMPNLKYPKLSRLLPAMASDEVQRNWTGAHGINLLKQTTTFLRALSYNFARLIGRPIDNATVLDFGCGYGRIARLFYYFTDEQNFFGVDPWDRSIELCRESGLNTNFFISDYLPYSLPVECTNFDLIYAFSVFTHLSQKATITSLNTLRNYLSDDGLLVITIRPIEYWPHDPQTTLEQKNLLIASHRENGFAFNPHKRKPIDGDITYGDTSMTLEWITTNCPGWKIASMDWSLEDTLQLYLFLIPQ